MDNFINAINKAIKGKNWHGALFIALTLPDICGKVEFPRLSSGKRYIDWFDEYMGNKYKTESVVFLSGEDCYALRCALLHEGTDDITQQRSRKILEQFVFMTDGPHCNLSQDNYVNGKKVETFLQLRVDKFCKDVCDSVEVWLKKVSKNTVIAKRLKNTIEIHEPGFVKGGIKFGEIDEN